MAVCSLGISAVMTQLTLMREFLTAFSGNEMIFGIILANWLLLMGLGSHLGRTASRVKDPLGLLIVAQIVIAILPLVNLFALRALRNTLFLRGSLVGPTETILSSFVLLLPYCLLAGYLLTLFCLILASKPEQASIGQVYSLDNVGSILGGLLFSVALVRFFSHVDILYIPAFLNLFFAGVLAVFFGRKILAILTGLVIIGLGLQMALVGLDRTSTRIQYAGQNVVYHGNSPYGGLVVTETAGQFNFTENGVPLFSTHDTQHAEETAHYPMIQRPRDRAAAVLLIGGCVTGTLKELSKYTIRRLDCVELDPLVIDVGQKFSGPIVAKSPIRILNTDGRRFVRHTKNRYDVVILDMPDPSTSQINRLFTAEFFAETKAILTDNGILSFSLGRYENYLSRDLATLIAIADRTLKTVFRNVLILPGGRIFFLASDGTLHAEIARRIEESAVPTEWLNRSYLDAVLTPDRMAESQRAVSSAAAINTDLNPTLYYHHLLYWISHFDTKTGILEILLLLLAIAYLFTLRPVSFAVFASGFSSSALLVILLLGFQILYGYVYHLLGVIVTLFMAGLALGSIAMNRMLARRRILHLAKLEFALAVYAGLIPFALMGLHAIQNPILADNSAVLIPLLSLIMGALVGLEFPLAGKLDLRQGSANPNSDGPHVTATAARLYTADFVGGCIGALLVSTLLVPLVGVMALCFLIAGLNIISGLIILFVRTP